MSSLTLDLSSTGASSSDRSYCSRQRSSDNFALAALIGDAKFTKESILAFSEFKAVLAKARELVSKSSSSAESLWSYRNRTLVEAYQEEEKQVMAATLFDAVVLSSLELASDYERILGDTSKVGEFRSAFAERLASGWKCDFFLKVEKYPEFREELLHCLVRDHEKKIVQWLNMDAVFKLWGSLVEEHLDPQAILEYGNIELQCKFSNRIYPLVLEAVSKRVQTLVCTDRGLRRKPWKVLSPGNVQTNLEEATLDYPKLPLGLKQMVYVEALTEFYSIEDILWHLNENETLSKVLIDTDKGRFWQQKLKPLVRDGEAVCVGAASTFTRLSWKEVTEIQCYLRELYQRLGSKEDNRDILLQLRAKVIESGNACIAMKDIVDEVVARRGSSAHKNAYCEGVFDTGFGKALWLHRKKQSESSFKDEKADWVKHVIVYLMEQKANFSSYQIRDSHLIRACDQYRKSGIDSPREVVLRSDSNSLLNAYCEGLVKSGEKEKLEEFLLFLARANPHYFNRLLQKYLDAEVKNTSKETFLRSDGLAKHLLKAFVFQEMQPYLEKLHESFNKCLKEDFSKCCWQPSKVDKEELETRVGHFCDLARSLVDSFLKEEIPPSVKEALALVDEDRRPIMASNLLSLRAINGYFTERCAKEVLGSQRRAVLTDFQRFFQHVFTGTSPVDDKFQGYEESLQPIGNLCKKLYPKVWGHVSAPSAASSSSGQAMGFLVFIDGADTD